MSEAAWDDTTDVVVLGGGGAGLRAAMCAAQEGVKVTLLEKCAEPGGKTGMSIGIMTASGTAIQREAGIEDSHARHLADIERMAAAAGTGINLKGTKFLLRECNRELAELMGMGIKFTGPFPEGPHGTPRLHVVQPDCEDLIDILIRACKGRGVNIICQAAGRDLVMDHNGQVAGVVAEIEGQTRYIGAGAVVLAAGDYSADAEFLNKVAPNAKRAEPLSDFATGDGHKMAMRVGAATQNMDKVNAPQLRFTQAPFVEPAPGLFGAGARLVTRGGESVATIMGPSAELPGYENRAEDFFIVIDGLSADRLAKASDDTGQSEGRGPARDGWMLTNKPFIGTAPGVGYAYLEDCRDWPWYHLAQDVDGVAAHMICGAEALSETIGANSPHPLAEGPLHVLGPARRCVTNSGGGLTTNQRLNVMATNGKPIAGLYGAGVNARMITFMGGHGYALAWALASGRVAGHWAGRGVIKRSAQA